MVGGGENLSRGLYRRGDHKRGRRKHRRVSGRTMRERAEEPCGWGDRDLCGTVP